MNGEREILAILGSRKNTQHGQSVVGSQFARAAENAPEPRMGR
jgi:hypothetical protein